MAETSGETAIFTAKTTPNIEAQQNSVERMEPAPLSKRMGVPSSGLEQGFYSVTLFFSFWPSIDYLRGRLALAISMFCSG